MLKKGAMFGLDARIALAIFGALSVISGATLYSAIQESKKTQFISQIEEVSKAISSYRLDTGSGIHKILSYNGSGWETTESSYIVELVDNSLNLSGWSGPYLSLEKITSTLRYNDYKISTEIFPDTRSSSTSLSGIQTCQKAVGNCIVYVKAEYVGADKASAISFINSLDNDIDSGDGLFKGKVHATQAGNATSVLDSSSVSNPIFYWRYAPIMAR